MAEFPLGNVRERETGEENNTVVEIRDLLAHSWIGIVLSSCVVQHWC